MTDQKIQISQLSEKQKEKLRELLKKKKQVSIPKRPEGEPIPVTDQQRQLWAISHLEGAKSAYNMVGAFEIVGVLDVSRLEKAVDILVRKNEILRTSFYQSEGEVYQRVHDELASRVHVHKIGLNEDKEKCVQEQIDCMYQVEFDLNSPGQFAFDIFQCSEELSYLFINFHHIISDAWSQNLFLTELVSLYTNDTVPSLNDDTPLAVQYPDYAYFCKFDSDYLEREKKSEEYWVKQFDGFRNSQILPFDTRFPNHSSFKGETKREHLSAGILDQFELISKRCKTTKYSILLALVASAIRLQTNKSDFVLGSSIANRVISPSENMLGLFANTLPLRINQQGISSFSELAKICTSVAIQAQENQIVAYDNIERAANIERSTSTPLIQLMVVLDNTPDNEYDLSDEITIKQLDAKGDSAKFNVTVFARLDGNDPYIDIQYNKELFQSKTIDLFFETIKCVLNDCSDNPNYLLDDLVFTPAFSNKSLNKWGERFSGVRTPWWLNKDANSDAGSVDVIKEYEVSNEYCSDRLSAYFCLSVHLILQSLVSGTKDVCTTVVQRAGDSGQSYGIPIRINIANSSFKEVVLKVEQYFELYTADRQNHTIYEAIGDDSNVFDSTACILDSSIIDLSQGFSTSLVNDEINQSKSLETQFCSDGGSNLRVVVKLVDKLSDIFDESELVSCLDKIFEICDLSFPIANKHFLDQNSLYLGAENEAFLESSLENLVEVFENSVSSFPEKKAISFNDTTYSYLELNAAVNRLSNFLLEKECIEIGDVVALCFEPSIETLVSLLAILKVGACYLPIDSNLPADRVSYVLEDAKPKCVLTNRNCSPLFSGNNVNKYELDGDQYKNDIQACSAENPSVTIDCDDIAYIIYTSGSTGNPKGVLVSHYNVIRLMTSCQKEFMFSPDEVWTLFHSVAFDFSVWEIWGALFFGGELVVVPYVTARSPVLFADLLESRRVTVLNQTPSAFMGISHEVLGRENDTSLKHVIFGGEALNFDSLVPWMNRFGESISMVNMYGITETTVHVTYREVLLEEVMSSKSASFIGKPLSDLAVVVLDECGDIVPEGVAGEMYVCGGGVSSGYLNREQLNKERFVQLKHFNSSLFYRTGDVAKKHKSGELEYLGRIDDQVKIRGYRIELGEIRQVLKENARVSDVYLHVRKDDWSQSYIVAYIVPASHSTCGDDFLGQVRGYAESKLPIHMVPAHFVSLQELPLTINGKVNKALLPEPSYNMEASQGFVEPTGELEKEVAEVWKKYLKVETVSLTDNFYKLGGDSIRSIAVVTELRNKGYSVSVEAVMTSDSLADLVNAISSAENVSDEQVCAPFSLLDKLSEDAFPEGVDDAYPMSLLQQTMLIEGAISSSGLYHNTASSRIKGSLDVNKFENALRYLVKKHDILRTKFDTNSYGENLQIVYKNVELPLSIEDCSDYSIADQESKIREVEEFEKNNPFSTEDCPLFRIKILILNSSEFQFYLSEHHAIMDGWSVSQFFNDLLTAYFEGLDDSAESDLDIQYKDFISVEKKALESKENLRFWTEKLSGVETTHIQPWHNQVKDSEQFELTETIDQKLADKLFALSEQGEFSLKSTLFASHIAILGKLSGQSSVLTGLSMHGRPDRANSEKLVGLFVSMLPVVIDLDDVANWNDLCAVVKRTEEELFQYRHFPLAAIQETVNRRNLLQNCFNFIHFPSPEKEYLDDFSVKSRSQHQRNGFPFSVTFNYLSGQTPSLTISVEFDPEVYSREQAEYIKNCYIQALTQLDSAKDESFRKFLSLPERDLIQNSFADFEGYWWDSEAGSNFDTVSVLIENDLYTALSRLEQASGIDCDLLITSAYMMVLYAIGGKPQVVTESEFGGPVGTKLPLCFTFERRTSQDLINSLSSQISSLKDLSLSQLDTELSLKGISLKSKLVFSDENTISDEQIPFRCISRRTDAGVALEFCVDSCIVNQVGFERIEKYFNASLQLLINNSSDEITRDSLIQQAGLESEILLNSDTKVDYTRNRCVHELIEQTVNTYGSETALVFNGEKLSYTLLNERANKLARHLIEINAAGPDVPVGICLDRSFEMVISILAILKSGSAYLPIDPEYPHDRISYMLENAGATHLITSIELQAVTASLYSVEKVFINDSKVIEEINNCSSDNIPVSTSSVNTNSLAYVIYTSGSTGKPKGVMIEHAALVNRIEWMDREYGASVADNFLQKTPFSFDVSVWEFIWPLVSGSTLVIAKKGGHKDPDYLSNLIFDEEITKLHFVPSMLSGMLAHGGLSKCSSIRQVFCSGEALLKTHVDEFFGQRPDSELHNLYGPTEATIDVSFWNCANATPETKLIPIGKAIQNTKLFVLDANFQPVGIGVPGELFIGGDGLGRGYINRVELTQERFIFANVGGCDERLYKTGDSVRVLENGDIEFLGRIDFQVKVRGFRIELGEIEVALNSLDAVIESAVIPVTFNQIDTQLVAYVVANEDNQVKHYQDSLKALLPEFMVPTHFIFLEKLPVTANGKLDRKKLAETKIECSAREYVEPTDDLQKQLCGLWEEVLGIPGIGILDDFFEIGGHSITAMKLSSRICQKLNVQVGIDAIFKYPCVQGLAEYICQLDGAEIEQIEHIGTTGEFPLSYSQLRLWLVENIEGNSSTYNMPGIIRLTNDANAEFIKEVYRIILERHSILRTSIYLSDEGNPVQKIIPIDELSFDVDIDYVSGENGVEDAYREFATAIFDLTIPPLFKAKLVVHENESCYLIVNAHHIVSDGWSLSLLVQEFNRLYQCLEKNESIDSTLPELEYSDYCIYQRNKYSDASENHTDEMSLFWRNLLKDAPRGIPLLKDRVVSSDVSAPNVLNTSIDINTVSQIKKLSNESGGTLFSTLLSALNVVLYKWTGESDVVVGSVSSGRGNYQLESLTGCFVNFITLRNQLDNSSTLQEIVCDTGKSTIDALANQDYPFDLVLKEVNPERTSGKNPFHNVSFRLQNLEMEALDLASEKNPYSDKVISGETQLELMFVAVERKGEINLSLQFDRSLFSMETGLLLLDQFKCVIETISSNPDALLSDVVISGGLEDQRQRYLRDFPKFVLSSTFTVDPLGSFISNWGTPCNKEISVAISPFNQVFQQLLNPESDLHTNVNGCSVILFRWIDWLGDEIHDEDALKGIAGDFSSALEYTAHRISTPLILVECPAQVYGYLSVEQAALLAKTREELNTLIESYPKVSSLVLSEDQNGLGGRSVYDSYMESEFSIPYTTEMYSAISTEIFRAYHQFEMKLHKVIVLDCDNTLWDGVCGELGPVGIKVTEKFKFIQEYMKSQLQNGMLLCLNSKNNYSDVEQVFSENEGMILSLDDVAAHRVNWDKKSANILSLADELNLGIDSFIFIDDDPIQCAEVRQTLPEVSVIELPQSIVNVEEYFSHLWVFDKVSSGSSGEERSKMYKDNRARAKAESSALTFSDFINNLGLEVSIDSLCENSIDRAEELSARTNQFNLTTIRRSKPEIKDMMGNADKYLCLLGDVKDRFGSYGQVCLALIEKGTEEYRVTDFMLSCRAMGRGVEHEFVRKIGEYALAEGIGNVVFEFSETEKNVPGKNFVNCLPFTGQHYDVDTGKESYRVSVKDCLDFHYELNGNESSNKNNHFYTRKNIVVDSKVNYSEIAKFSLELAQMAKDQNLDSSGSERSANNSDTQLSASEVESILHNIWVDVLGVDAISLSDSFFELGGNSLGLVTLARLLRKHSITVNANDLYKNATFSKMVGVCSLGLSSAEEGREVTVLTEGARYKIPPNKRWYFNGRTLDLDGWGISILFEFSEKGDYEQHIKEVVSDFISQQPSLRAKLVWEDDDIYEEIGALDTDLYFSVSNVDAGEVNDGVFLKEFQKRIKIKEKMFDIAYCKCGAGEKDFIVLSMHHLVYDLFSMQRMFSYFESNLNLTDPKSQIRVPKASVTIPDVIEEMTQWANSDDSKECVDYWLNRPIHKYTPFVTDYDYVPSDNSMSSTVSFKGVLSEQQTTKLIDLSRNIKDVSLFGIFISSLIEALSEEYTSDVIAFEFPINSRRSISGNLDFVDALGYFVTHIPVFIDVPKSSGVVGYVRDVSKQLEDGLAHGAGANALRYYSENDSVENFFSKLPIPDIGINYIDPSAYTNDSSVENVDSFGELRLTPVSENIFEGGARERVHKISITCSVIDGCMTLEWDFSDNLYDVKTINRISDRCMGRLINFTAEHSL